MRLTLGERNEHLAAADGFAAGVGCHRGVLELWMAEAAEEVTLVHSHLIWLHTFVGVLQSIPDQEEITSQQSECVAVMKLAQMPLPGTCCVAATAAANGKNPHAV